MPRPPHIVFAGSTPGLIYPGLAVAANVVGRRPDAMATFMGTGKALERHAVRAAGFHYANVPAQSAPEKPLHAVRFVTDNVAGYWASLWWLKEHHVSLVVGLGGYASAPTVRAAITRRIPTVLLESNAIPSRVNRWFAGSASAVCAGFPEVRPYFGKDAPLLITGNPARPAFERLYRETRSLRLYDPNQPEPVRERPREKRLVIIGGAGGARSLNECMPRVLWRLRNQLKGWQIVHQSGEGQLQETEQRYRQAGVESLVVAFIDEMASVMFESDLVISRAASTTLAELALAGVPAVLVPILRASESSQLANAEIFAAGGAATIVDEAEVIGSLDDALVSQIKPLIINDSARQEMATNMRGFARPEAAARVTDALFDIDCEATARRAA
jgi:UDP-N-acetylglucosamine--N-acetylmuramyl-(pentapeptide) pyrophosphoryl-undecaprenol N-acetylglucosamine transferase